MSATEACRNCRFSKTDAGSLICRRYPPKPLSVRGHFGFPSVGAQDWCGEWMGMRPGAGLPAEIAPAPKRSTEVASGRAA